MTRNLALLRSLVLGDVDALRSGLAQPGAAVEFLGFARRHKLGAYIYRTLRELELASALPPALAAAAKATSLLEQRVSDRLVQEMSELRDVFAAGGAPVLFIKGPLFAQRFYGSLDARGIADLDVLIRKPEDIRAVDALLREAGYERAFRVPVSHRVAQYFAHHFEYRRDSLQLDVHWALQRHVTFAVDHDRVWETATRVSLNGSPYETASDEYELVLQILGFVTDLQVGKLTLRSPIDIYRILRAVEGTLDWPEFFAWRRRERILRPSLYVLSAALDVLDCHDEFPTLAGHLEAASPGLPPTSVALRALLDSRPLAPAQKLAAFRIYDARPAAAFTWWLVSLPFRVAVYGVTDRRRTRPLVRGPAP